MLLSTSLLKKLLKPLAKLSFVALLLFFLGKKGLLSVSELPKIFENPRLLGTSLLLSLISLVLGVWRWKLLLRGQEITLNWKKTFELSLIGNFFNIALPGAVSGDLVKAFYIAKDFPGKRGHAFGSILFDRIVGVSGLILTSTAALLAGYQSLHDTPVFEAIKWFVLFSGSGVLIFFGYLFFLPEKSDPVLAILERLQRRIEKLASVTRIYEGVRNYHRHRWVALQSLAISCVIHVLGATSCVLFTMALEPSGTLIPWLSLFTLAPLGLLATALPLAPAGVGTGHAAFSWLFLLLGFKSGANVFSVFVLFQILWSMAGGIVYLRHRPDLASASPSKL